MRGGRNSSRVLKNNPCDSASRRNETAWFSHRSCCDVCSSLPCCRALHPHAFTSILSLASLTSAGSPPGARYGQKFRSFQQINWGFCPLAFQGHFAQPPFGRRQAHGCPPNELQIIEHIFLVELMGGGLKSHPWDVSFQGQKPGFSSPQYAALLLFPSDPLANV